MKIDSTALKEFPNLSIFKSLLRSPQGETVRSKYSELMKSFKSDADEEGNKQDTQISIKDEEIPIINTKNFAKELISKTKMEKKKNEKNVFKNEEKAWEEIMKNMTNKPKSIVPQSHQISNSSSFVSIFPRNYSTSMNNMQENAIPKPVVLSSKSSFVSAAKQKIVQKPIKRQNKPKTVNSEFKISKLIERTYNWQEKVKSKILHEKTKQKAAELTECTFSPVRITSYSKLAKNYENSVQEKTQLLLNTHLNYARSNYQY